MLSTTRSPSKVNVLFNTENVPEDILFYLFFCIFRADSLYTLVQLSLLNKAMHKSVFDYCKQESVLHLINSQVISLNTLFNYGEFTLLTDQQEVEQLARMLWEKMGVLIDSMQDSILKVAVYGNGKKRYQVSINDRPLDPFFISFAKIPFFGNVLRNKKFINECTMENIQSKQYKHKTWIESRLTFNESEIYAFDDSSISPEKINKKVLSDAANIQTEITTAVRNLLVKKSIGSCFVQFILEVSKDKNKKNLKLLLRFNDHRDSRELMYALQKEGYRFILDQDEKTEKSEANVFRNIDIFPCEARDAESNSVHRFMSASSIEFNGLQQIFRFLFETCQIRSHHILFFKNTPELKFTTKRIFNELKQAMYLFLLHAKNIYEKRQAEEIQGTIFIRISFFSKTKNKLNALKEALQKLQSISSCNELSEFFTELQKKCGKTLKIKIQNFQAVSECINTEIKNTEKVTARP